MPLYQFECTKCEEISEFLLGISEAVDMEIQKEVDLKEYHWACKCGSTKFKRLLSAHSKSAFNWGSWATKK
jgi:predicted nucleic acid-binding Zn ribbon protein